MAQSKEAPFDHWAFERADMHDLAVALQLYKSNHTAGLAHMYRTLHPTCGFDWHLRHYPPFVEAFPADADALNTKWNVALSRLDPDQRSWLEDRTILNFDDEDLFYKGLTGVPLSAEEAEALRKIHLRIQRKPQRDDLMRIVHYHEDRVSFKDEYTKGAHAELVKLIEPLKALIHDVDDKNKAILLPPVRAIGEELQRKGGVLMMQAVYYGVTALLAHERAYCADGQPWSDAKSTLNFAWDGIGIWRA